ncbi:TetR/AcrR family transcriptional regulator [Sphingosinicella microcystinivorans]|uniref:TetR/AcrR family transcriptional regulator n=1 Tax=Sphingosinicella microcystinivorans TaxID=335406 RepID=UPI0022F40192|nr:TetR/AcrR family transcriptional regulator [Sphingosinicella microcystinivorans]WBX86134.1 TetR/AcrR family transcriptional regulator [Sphingosinicella microcystinivorans]
MAKAAARRGKSEARIKKDQATRLLLIEAAGKLIGEHGYAGCSIARLTLSVGIAHGAFYLHFSSQQDLFDQILPTLGTEMADEIGNAVRDCKNVVEAERRGFLANFEYLNRHPYMYRVMAEAELFAPQAYMLYQQSAVEKYAKSLKRNMAPELAAGFELEELKVIATALIGARINLLRNYGVKDWMIHPIPPGVLDAYERFTAHSLRALVSDPRA